MYELAELLHGEEEDEQAIFWYRKAIPLKYKSHAYYSLGCSLLMLEESDAELKAQHLSEAKDCFQKEVKKEGLKFIIEMCMYLKNRDGERGALEWLLDCAKFNQSIQNLAKVCQLANPSEIESDALKSQDLYQDQLLQLEDKLKDIMSYEVNSIRVYIEPFAVMLEASNPKAVLIPELISESSDQNSHTVHSVTLSNKRKAEHEASNREPKRAAYKQSMMFYHKTMQNMPDHQANKISVQALRQRRESF